MDFTRFATLGCWNRFEINDKKTKSLRLRIVEYVEATLGNEKIENL